MSKRLQVLLDEREFDELKATAAREGVMIFIDANIPMYLVGAAEDRRDAAAVALTAAVRRRERLVTDAEVFQEILRRYRAIRRDEAIRPAFGVLLDSGDEVLPIELVDVEAAREIVLAEPAASARDCLHVAVMRRHGVDMVMTFDKGVERHPGIRRIS